HLLLKGDPVPLLLQQRVDPIGRIEYMAHGHVMVERIDDESDKFAHIGHYKVRLLFGLWRKVGQVGGDDPVDVAFLIVLVKVIKAFCEKAKGGADENPSRAPVLDLSCHIQHTFSGGDHIVHDDHMFSLDVFPQEFMGDDGVLAVYHGGVIPAFVEHTHVDAQNVGKVNGAVHGAFIRAYDHQVLLVLGKIRFRPQKSLH